MSARQRHFLFVCVMVLGCKGKGDDVMPNGCGSDSECKGDRICVKGMCMSPGGGSASGDDDDDDDDDETDACGMPG